MRRTFIVFTLPAKSDLHFSWKPNKTTSQWLQDWWNDPRTARHHKWRINETIMTGWRREMISILTVLMLLPCSSMAAPRLAFLRGSVKDVWAAVWKQLCARAQRRAFHLRTGRAHGDERSRRWGSSHRRLHGAGSRGDTWGTRLKPIKIAWKQIRV